VGHRFASKCSFEVGHGLDFRAGLCSHLELLQLTKLIGTEGMIGTNN
jgi:hypothetical protein